jgi:N-acetylmuramoyl-L-alanine amidase
VGNVVLNRVADESCPDTIYDVIFDNKYGVQFSVTTNGTIYMDPSEESIIAAKICLEGYSVVGDSIYFVNPDIGVSSWFVNTRTFVKSIGDHDFYA